MKTQPISYIGIFLSFKSDEFKGNGLPVFFNEELTLNNGISHTHSLFPLLN